MIKEARLKLHSKEFFASISTLSFIIFYIVYPVWLVPGVFFLSFLSLLSFISIAIALFAIVFKIIPDYEIKISKSSLSDPLFLKDKKFLLLFLGIALYYIFILIPSLSSVFTARGDEGWHVNKIVYLANIYSLSQSIPFLMVWIIGVMSLTCILIIILIFSNIGMAQIRTHFKDHRNWFILGTICFSLLTLMGSFFLVSYFYQYTNLSNIFNRERIIRFGPIHPLTSLMIFFLFPWNDFALKSYSLVLIIVSAFIIRQVFLELSSERNTLSQLLAVLTTVIFLFFPVIMTYACLVYLTAGVVFFFTLTTFTLVKFLKTSSRSYLFFTFYLLGIGFLWKTVHLFCGIGIGLTLIVHLLLQKRSSWREIFISYSYMWLISFIFIVPWSLLSLNPGFHVSHDVARFDLSLLFTEAIFDYFSRATVEMGPIGIWCYFAIIIYFIWSIFEKKIEKLAIFLIFFAWYLPFNLDVGWGHYVDRFMVPALSLLVLSLFLIIKDCIEILKSWKKMSLFLILNPFKKKKTWLKIVLGVTMIGTLGITSIAAIDLQEGTANRFVYLPIDELALYIANNMNSSDVVYLGFGGVTPVGFYLEKFHVQAFTISTVWTSFKNQNLTNFLEFLHSIQATYFIFPFWGNEGYYSTSLVNELIDNPLTDDYRIVKQIDDGESAIYIWRSL